jgi:hypothetical protein
MELDAKFPKLQEKKAGRLDSWPSLGWGFFRRSEWPAWWMFRALFGFGLIIG